VRPLAALTAVLLVACSEPPAPPQVPGAVPTVEYRRGADWPSYNRDLAGTRFSPLRQVSATNVDELRQAWSYPLGSSAAAEGSELTPLVVDGVLYATAADRVVALRADTGAEIWRFALAQGVPSQRGLAYWSGDAAAAVPARIFFTVGRTLVALDAATGQKIPAFGAGGEVTMPSPYAGAPTLFEDFIIVGSNGPPGNRCSDSCWRNCARRSAAGSWRVGRAYRHHAPWRRRSVCRAMWSCRHLMSCSQRDMSPGGMGRAPTSRRRCRPCRAAPRSPQSPGDAGCSALRFPRPVVSRSTMTRQG
jgi:hypothetical protein